MVAEIVSRASALYHLRGIKCRTQSPVSGTSILCGSVRAVNDFFDIDMQLWIAMKGFPAVVLGLIITYLYLKDRYNHRP